jgi:hypothetical protein
MPPKFISIKDFDSFQHFKKANPPWVKMYRSTFCNREFMRLPVASKFLYLGLVMLASEGCNRVPYDLQYISHRLATTFSQNDLTPLYKAGLLEAAASTVYRVASLSVETETETETETDFDVFWKAYPRKVGGKKNALKAWGKAEDRPPLADILAAIERAKQTEQWKRDGGQFIPYPATWLNKGMWDDDVRPMESAFKRGMNSFLERHKEEA